MLRPSLRMNLAQKGGRGPEVHPPLKFIINWRAALEDRYIMVNMRNGPRVALLRPPSKRVFWFTPDQSK